ncbi:VOC family protein [Streptomyces cucumeris]|uniref:VOC family protein n=1 Tax=Streptomyces cucumeris TaxID=2962890 RepID=UPI003EBC1DAD
MSASTGAGPAICPTLLYRDAGAAIALLTEGFGFTRVAVYEDGAGVVQHAELAYGNGVVMLGSAGRGGVFARAMADAGPTGVYVAVDDVDAHHRRAAAYGVEILMPPTDQDYGARDYLARDPEGNVWSFGSYVPATAG